MATFETLPHFEASWWKLTREQQAVFRAVVLEAFEPDLMTPRPSVPAQIACQIGGWASRAIRDDLESRWAGDVQLWRRNARLASRMSYGRTS